MKVIGKGSIKIYEGIDECPHAPGPEALWQESMVIYMWDMEQQCYVFLRMSQEPNRGPGYTTVWLNAWTPEHMYKHTDDSIPMQPGDREKDALNAGGGLCRYQYDGKHHWTVNDEDTHIQLSMEDYHPGFGYWADDSGFLVDNTAKNHLEATGWVKGTVSIKGKTYQIAGIGWRDHSWGKRNWRGILVHRFYPALFGKDFSFFGVTLLGADGTMGKFGTLIRGDTVQAADDFDMVAYMDEDGVSNQGGRLRLRFEGQTYDMEFELLAKCAISLHQDFPCVDGMCKVTMGDRIGVGVSETSTRPQGGTGNLHVFPNSSGVLANGIHAQGPATWR